jgi:hypothetical protein
MANLFLRPKAFYLNGFEVYISENYFQDTSVAVKILSNLV